MLYIIVSLLTTDNELSVNNLYFSNEITETHRDPGPCE